MVRIKFFHDWIDFILGDVHKLRRHKIRNFDPPSPNVDNFSFFCNKKPSKFPPEVDKWLTLLPLSFYAVSG